MKAETPLAFGSDSVRAMTTVVDATDAFVMNALLPFRIHSPCFSSARVRNAAASEPEPGSVRPHAPNPRPVASAGRYFAFCSGVSSKSTSDRGADVLADEADDVLGRGAGREQLLHAHRLQGGDVLGRDDPAAEDRDVPGALLREQIEHALEEVVVGAGEHGE